MARPGITYEEVQNAADTLVGRAESPTIQRVREHLGTGSPNTIHRHLTTWRAALAPAKREAAKLPEELASALADEIERQASAARAAAEAATLEAQNGADELAATGEGLEQQADELTTLVETLTVERDAAVAERDNAHVENERLRADLDQLRSSNDDILQSLAESRNRVITLTEQRDDLQKSHTAAAEAAKVAEAGRVDAERDMAVAVARLEAAQHQADERLESLKIEQKGRMDDAAQHREDLAALREDWSGRVSAVQEKADTDAAQHRIVLSDLHEEWQQRLAAAEKATQDAQKRASDAERSQTKAEAQAEALKALESQKTGAKGQ